MHGLTGKYRLDTRLGGGGMAEVFIGSTVGAEGFSRKVAIKRILPGFSDNPAFAQMFVAEAQISSQLQHPNIVSVLDFDRDPDGRLFLVMELVEGKDLDDLVSTGMLPIAVVIHVIAEVLRGLGYAHNLPTSESTMRGLVHRDVSPHNVLVSWEGAVKVSDFGIAKARAASSATASMFIKGKPQYMSPEQANGQPLDGRADLFAVGVMLWEMLTGQRLFVGSTTQEVLARMLFSPIAWPRQIRPEVPIDLERIAMRLLERNLAARYPAAEDVVEDLLACKDAPRGGRDELIAVMVDRFPGLAPVRPVRRGSVPSGPYQGGETRAWAGAAPAPNQYAASPNASTARGPTPNAVPIVAPPASSPPAGLQQTIRGVVDAPSAPAATAAAPPVAAMSAETRTVAPVAPRRRLPIAVVVVGLAVVALLATLIVLVVARDHRANGTAGGSGTAAGSAGSGSAIAVATVAIDAAMPDAMPPPDAPSPDAGRPDARPAKPDARTSSPRADARPSSDCTVDRGEHATGSVKITAEPWAIVTIDGVRQPGQTPITKSLLVGCHTIKLDNSELDKTLKKKVTIEPGRMATVSVDWR